MFCDVNILFNLILLLLGKIDGYIIESWFLCFIFNIRLKNSVLFLTPTVTNGDTRLKKGQNLIFRGFLNE